MRHLLLIALRNMLAQRRRSLLLGGGIAFVTIVLVLLLAVSTGMQNTLVRTATTLATGHVNVGGFYKISSSASGALITDTERIRRIVGETVPEAELVVERGRGFGKIISPTGSIYSSINGVEVGDETAFREVVEVQAGDLDKLGEPGTALVFQAQADKLGVDVGDVITLAAPTPRGVNNSADVTVVAIAKDAGFMSSFSVYVPQKVIRSLYDLSEDTTGVVMLHLPDMGEVDRVAVRLRDALSAAGFEVMETDARPFWQKFQDINREDWRGLKLDVTTWEDEVAGFVQIIDGFDWISGLLVTVLIVLIIIGIMNTLWMAIRERTGEIGTLRAVGMPQSQVLVMFLLEAALLSVFAVVIGAVLGVVLVASLDAAQIELTDQAVRLFLMSDTLTLELDPVRIVRALATIVFFTTLGALLPAARAARMPPLTAIHHG